MTCRPKFAWANAITGAAPIFAHLSRQRSSKKFWAHRTSASVTRLRVGRDLPHVVPRNIHDPLPLRQAVIWATKGALRKFRSITCPSHAHRPFAEAPALSAVCTSHCAVRVFGLTACPMRCSAAPMIRVSAVYRCGLQCAMKCSGVSARAAPQRAHSSHRSAAAISSSETAAALWSSGCVGRGECGVRARAWGCSVGRLWGGPGRCAFAFRFARAPQQISAYDAERQRAGTRLDHDVTRVVRGGGDVKVRLRQDPARAVACAIQLARGAVRMRFVA